MKRLIQLIYLTVLLNSLSSCNSQNCEELEETFDSYSQAINQVESATFEYNEKINTSKSSWIVSASYYSCDSIKGFLIIETRKKNFIYQRVPLTLWNDFKIANSYGGFYNKFIKGNYRLIL